MNSVCVVGFEDDEAGRVEAGVLANDEGELAGDEDDEPSKGEAVGIVVVEVSTPPQGWWSASWLNHPLRYRNRRFRRPIHESEGVAGLPRSACRRLLNHSAFDGRNQSVLLPPVVGEGDSGGILTGAPAGKELAVGFAGADGIWLGKGVVTCAGSRLSGATSSG